MTVSQLYSSVAQLGFEYSLEDEDRFLFAANRALLQVNAIRPVTRAYIINHKPLENKVKDATFEPREKTDELFFYAENVKSYYFEADGKGTLSIEKYEASEEKWTRVSVVEFAGVKGFTAYRGFIKQDGEFVNASIRLHFIGEYVYSIKCVAMYEHLYSENAEDIPSWDRFIKYDISALVTDFLSLSSQPIIEAENIKYINQPYGVEDGRIILLPHDIDGLYKIIYNKLPRKIISENGAANDESDIDLDEDLCALLPMLIASYIWVDDEPEKAQYYLALYRERVADIERRKYDVTPVPINFNGW